MREWIGGRNPVREVLRAGKRRAHRLLLARGTRVQDVLAEVVRWCDGHGIPIDQAPREELDARESGHQGVCLEVDPYPYADFDAILESSLQGSAPPFLLLLDTLQDPQNLGTLLRTGEAVGVHGVLLPYRRTATVTPAVVRASSGATEHLAIAQTNLAQAIQQMKPHNIWVIGLEGTDEAASPDRIDLNRSLALVVGNEGQGMRRLVRESCDLLLRLPMRGEIESLNAAVAGSVALYLAWRARGFS